jgi:hypothetical protein
MKLFFYNLKETTQLFTGNFSTMANISMNICNSVQLRCACTELANSGEGLVQYSTSTINSISWCLIVAEALIILQRCENAQLFADPALGEN